MYEEIIVQRLSMGSLFKLLIIGLSLTFFPICILFGVMAFFGTSTIQWNNEYVYGLSGLLVSPVIGVMLVAMMSCFVGFATGIGLWLYSQFRPISLVIKKPNGVDQGTKE